jgi:hypothetical protein
MLPAPPRPVEALGEGRREEVVEGDLVGLADCGELDLEVLAGETPAVEMRRVLPAPPRPVWM